MKHSEFIRIVQRNGWQLVRIKGSHYIFEKGGIISPPVPNHGSKEIGKGLVRTLVKQMKLEYL